jgi:hypothetical protein
MTGGGSTGRRPAIEYRDQVTGSLYEDILVCNANLLPEPVPPGRRAVAASKHFVLLRRQ